jgi:hypothetical protein
MTLRGGKLRLPRPERRREDLDDAETAPDVGGTRPAAMARRLLLPDPDGPRMATSSPSSTVILEIERRQLV